MIYSSNKQNGQSVKGQKRVCSAFCNQNNYEAVGTYIDHALTATKDTLKRIEFQKRIMDSAKENFEGVVVYKLDRFAKKQD